jgi:hypothetical protein
MKEYFQMNRTICFRLEKCIVVGVVVIFCEAQNNFFVQSKTFPKPKMVEYFLKTTTIMIEQRRFQEFQRL